MNNNSALTTVLLLLLCFVFRVASGDTATTGDAATSSNEASADEMAAGSVAPIPGEYTKKGADTCIRCHDEDSEYPVFDIFKSKHGKIDDKRTPFATLQCEACHGPGVSGVAAMEEAKKKGGHVGKVRPGQKRPPIMNFGAKSDESVETQNKMCLNCHQGGEHIGWQGSKHGGNDLACADCHTIHTAHDPVTAKKTQADVCYKCHADKRADFYKPSRHPVREGQMDCTDCHNPHGGDTEAQLLKPTLNQTCYTCHAEKRGPFLWEHAPVAEDCSLCHTPHGSIQPALLSKRAPLLCQQCHSQMGHPSIEQTTAGLPSGMPSAFLLNGACLNCHSQVHGSNNPSGVKLMR